MRATPAELAVLLAGEPAGALRLDGLRVQRGDGRPAAAGSVQLAGARFVEPGGEARALDLSGWTLLPGLCDAHLHLFHEARRRLRVDLSGVRRRSELWERLQASAAESAGPLIGVGWDESAWDEPRFPTRRELDALLPGRPVGLIRVCGHVAVANGEALRLLGQPASEGLLLEGEAVALARRFPLGQPELLEAAAKAASDLARQGLTAVTDMGAADLPALAAALPADFPLRVEYFHAGPLAELPTDGAPGPGRPLGRKFFLDGSIGGRSAAVAAPYVEGGTGELLYGDAALRSELAAALAAGWSVALHAIGERALAQALDCLAALRPPAGRARLEHVELLLPGQAERAAALDLAVCMQPNFMDRWGRQGGLYARALGEGWRARFGGPADWRRVGATLAYGTDGMPAALWPALRAAVDPEVFGGATDAPEAAIAAVTGDAARAAGREVEWGRVLPGHSADFCLVERDPAADYFRGEVTPALTVRAGRPTWIASHHQGR
ncbi:amidohydrolase family protein [bacterium]|nr:amidohydrolase family protein [bacterium]